MVDLLIEIAADAKKAEKTYDDLRKETEDLEKQLSSIAKISAVGFAALTAEVGLSVKAFEEADAASRKLSQSLQLQGIYSNELKESYKSYAEAVETATGVDADALTAAQATAQGYLGQTKITKELTFAIADLAETMNGDLDGAAKKIALTVGTSTNAFKKEGLVLEENLTKQERLAKVMEFVNGRYKDQAAQANKGIGGIKGLTTAFGNLQEELGQRFAPVISAGIKAITSFFRAIQQNKVVLDLAAGVVAAGLALTALGTIIPLAVTGFLALKAAIAAAGIAITGTRIALTALIGATGIGLVIVAITYLALNWESASARIRVAVQGLVTFVTGAFSGLGKVISGAFSLDVDKIKEGLAEVQTAFKEGAAQATQELPKMQAEANEQQDALLKESADKREAAANDEAARRLAAIQTEQLTEAEADQRFKEEQLRIQVESNNKKLLETRKYGLAYATLNQLMQSQEVQGFKTATTELVQLTQSKNETLKGIGKAAAVANIVIQTAQSAMNVFAGFSTIPIIGPTLGFAAAAAAVAFGAEQIATVTGARDGALVPGISMSRDSVPFMLEPGELVVPKRNFEEVVGSVQATRGAAQDAGVGSGSATVELVLKDGLMDFIEAKQVERRSLGISVLG